MVLTGPDPELDCDQAIGPTDKDVTLGGCRRLIFGALVSVNSSLN